MRFKSKSSILTIIIISAIIDLISHYPHNIQSISKISCEYHQQYVIMFWYENEVSSENRVQIRCPNVRAYSGKIRYYLIMP